MNQAVIHQVVSTPRTALHHPALHLVLDNIIDDTRIQELLEEGDLCNVFRNYSRHVSYTRFVLENMDHSHQQSLFMAAVWEEQYRLIQFICEYMRKSQCYDITTQNVPIIVATLLRRDPHTIMNMCRFLHALGAKVDEVTFATVCSTGNMQLAQWLRSVNCPWDATAVVTAKFHRNSEIHDWCLLHHCPLPDYATDHDLWSRYWILGNIAHSP